MTHQQAMRRFRREVIPGVVSRFGLKDKPACRQAWNDYTNSLHRDGEITERQYNTWTGPKSCTGTPRRRRG